MDYPAAQTSVSLTEGPTRSLKGLNPIVDDLAELFQNANLTVDEINSIWLEFKKVLYIGDQQNPPTGLVTSMLAKIVEESTDDPPIYAAVTRRVVVLPS